ncbi:ankyrin repeat domain-containing protein 55-like [Cotesia typhae]|uniref:ankyrin repeat domain-containing protein 55-like n=1 Tax=Cotesia typhae TaxID=2053667 RepID=UPI003D689794
MMYEQKEIQYGRQFPNNYEEQYRKQVSLYFNSQFRATVSYGLEMEVKYFLEHGADVNCRTAAGLSVLCIAMRKNRYDMAQFLLSNGADPNDPVELEGTFAGYTPLHVALREKQWEFVKLLLCKYQVDMNIPAADGSLPIHYAVVSGKLDVLRLLLDRGANVNVEFSKRLYEKIFVYKLWTDKCKNYTLLAHAILSKNLNVMELLINNGADISTVSAKKVALFYAIESEQSVIVQYLLHKIGKKVDLKIFLEKITVHGFKPIQYAVLLGNTKIVETLLEAGADPNSQFRRVHYTKYLGYRSWRKKLANTMSLLTHVTDKNNVEMTRILQKFGAKDNAVVHG